MALYNVVKDYDWCLNDASEVARKEAPYIWLTEYQQTWASLWQSLDYYWTQAASIGVKGNNPYASLYKTGASTGSYKLPFFDSYHHEVNNSWGENSTPLQGAIDIMENLAKFISPTVGVERTKGFEGTTAAQYTFKFNLINTKTKDAWKRNKQLVDRLIYQNLQNRENVLTSLPPSIYTVEVPGVRYSPVAVINRVAVNNVGQLNLMYDTNTDVVVPDMYEVSISIQELISESKNIFEYVASGASTGKVRAIDIVEDSAKDIIAKKVFEENFVATAAAAAGNASVKKPGG